MLRAARARAATPKKHNPFAYYADVVAASPSRCADWCGFGALAADLRAGRLPTYAWISPNLCDDGARLRRAPAGDRFLARTVPALLRELGPRGFLGADAADAGHAPNAGCCARAVGRAASRRSWRARTVRARSAQRSAAGPLRRARDDRARRSALATARARRRDPRSGSLDSLFVRAPRVRMSVLARGGSARSATVSAPRRGARGAPTMGRPVTEPRRQPLIPRREVDPRQELPELELEVLERWRERDVFAESLRMRARGAAVGLLRGPADGERAAGLPPRALARVQGHLPALSDDARLPRRAQGRLGLPRAAGRDRRRTEARHLVTRRRSRSTVGIERFNAECRASVFAYLEEWNRLTERIGFWLDLEHAYRTLDESYIESVWWALAQIARARPALRGPQGRALLPALRDDALLARGRARLPGRGRPERVPEAAAWRGGERAAAGVDDDAVDAARQRRGGGVARRATYARVRARRGATFVLAEARVAAVLGEDAEIARALQRRASSRRATAPTHGPIFAAQDRDAGAAADPRRRVRHDRGRHRHRAPRAGVRRGRLPRGRGRAGGAVRPDAARTRCTTRCSPDGTYDARVRDRDGRLLRGALRQGPGADARS